MDNSKQKTTKTARPAATIIWTTSPLALSTAIGVPRIGDPGTDLQKRRKSLVLKQM